MVRQNPTTVSNVVTYTTVVIVDNTAGLLRPGMTANALVQTQGVAGVLIVPLQALEWKPSAAVATQYHLAPRAGPSKPGATKPGIVAGSQFGATMGAGSTALPSGSTGLVFVLRAGVLVAVPVKILLTSATQVAVKPIRGTLAANDAVVTADSTGPAPKSGAASKAAAPGFGGPSQGGGAARAVH
jgi:HlyD family secretion protein